MQRYFGLMAAVMFSIPLFAGAKMSPSPVPFEKGNVCPPPFSDKKWLFTNPIALMEAGRCVAYISGSNAPIPANDWQSFLGLRDRDENYTDGAGAAACQRAVCRVDIGGGARDFRELIDMARVAPRARNGSLSAPLPAMPVAPPANGMKPCVR